MPYICTRINSKWITNLNQLKSSSKVMETINKMKKHPTEWDNIFANHILDNGLISKIYNELICFNAKKKAN